MLDGREYLPVGTQLKLETTGSTYEIIGEPVGYGGGSIIYPVQKCYFDDGNSCPDAIPFVLKECYPVADGRQFYRSETGEIVPDDEEDLPYLHKIQEFQLQEEIISKTVYKVASRMVPIREYSQVVTLKQPGKPETTVKNTVSIMDSLQNKGKSLSRWMKDRTKFTPVEALKIIRQVLFALREVHDSDYLHLDLQPGNIFLDGLDDHSELVTLFDFGCARKMFEGKTTPVTDRVILTAKNFSAPEILLKNDGTLSLGVEADIFSVGCLAVYLLTGMLPNIWEIVYDQNGKYLERQIKCIKKFPKHLRDSLHRLLSQALAKEPQDRYHCVEAMLQDLERLLLGLQPYRTALVGVKYDAYIAYSNHGDLDRRAAVELQRALESYRAPKDVCEKRRPFGKVFLDTGELSSCADLSTQLREALANSAFLIIVCSKKTPQSSWIKKEIEMFLELHNQDRSRVLAVLIDGSPKTAFPLQLQADESGNGEVFAAHAIGNTAWQVAKKIRSDAFLRVAAPMLETSYDTLKQRRKLAQLQKCAAIVFGCFFLTTAFLGYALNRAHVINRQREEILLNESLFLSEQAQKRLAENDVHGAIELCLQALPEEDSDRPTVTEAEFWLGRALNIYSTPGSAHGSITATGMISTDKDSFALDSSGSHLLVWDSFGPGGIEIWDAESLKMVRHLYQDSEVTVEPCGLIDNKLIVHIGTEVACVEYLTGKKLWTIQNTNLLLNVHTVEKKKQILLFSDIDDQLHVALLSDEGGLLQSWSYDIKVQPGEKIWTSENGEWVAVYSECDVQILNLSDGSHTHLDTLDSNVQTLEIIGDLLCVIRSNGFSGVTSQEKVKLTVAEQTEVVFETFSLRTGECLFSYASHGFSEGGISRILPLRDKAVFLWSNYCILMSLPLGEVSSEYILPVGVVNIECSETGFETINRDGTLTTAAFMGAGQSESIVTRELWKKGVNKAIHKDGVFFIQGNHFAIQRFEENKYDGEYRQIWTGETGWRVVDVSLLEEKMQVIMVRENQVALVDTSGKEIRYSVPEEWGLSRYSDAWIQEERLFWINGGKNYSVNLLNGKAVEEDQLCAQSVVVDSDDEILIHDQYGEPILIWSMDNIIVRYDGSARLDLKQYNTLSLFSIPSDERKWEWIDGETLLVITDYQSFLLDVSESDLKMKATIDHCIGYDPQAGFLVADLDGPTYALGIIPKHSLQSLIEKGRVFLGR